MIFNLEKVKSYFAFYHVHCNLETNGVKNVNRTKFYQISSHFLVMAMTEKLSIRVKFDVKSRARKENWTQLKFELQID